MREIESSLQEFGEFVLKAQLVRQSAAPYFVRWVRRFLSRPASDEPLMDQVRGFCEDLERNGGAEDWQVRQADQALRIYYVNFLKRTDWHRRPTSTVVDEHGRTSPLAALEQHRLLVRTRHYSYRTECTYADWVRRFLDYAAQQQGGPHLRVESEVVRDYLTHLAVRHRVSASTQNQAFCAILFLCREVLGVSVESVSPGVKAKRGERLPVVLSMPETVALLGAMSGTPRLMAALIYGGGLRVSECCELRVKDIDFDQGLVFVRRAKGDKDRSTLLAEFGREELRAHLRRAEAQHQADPPGGTRGCVDARGSGPQVSECGPGAWLVLGVSEPDAVNRSARRCRTSASHERLGDSEGGQGGGARGADPQAGFSTYAAERVGIVPTFQRRLISKAIRLVHGSGVGVCGRHGRLGCELAREGVADRRARSPTEHRGRLAWRAIRRRR
jgi:integrase